MTSTPVKGTGFLMNFAGAGNLSKTGSSVNRTGSFGDVMDKAKSGAAYSQNQAITNQSKAQRQDTVNPRRDTVKSAETAKETAKPEEMTPEQEKALEEAGEEIVKEVAEELGVSEEDVENAMEELGLSVYSLFDTSNMTQLVLQLEGGLDAAALLTDGDLFAKLQNLLNMTENVKTGLMQEMNLNPEEMKTFLENLQDKLSQPENNGELMQEAAKEETPEITVEVKSGDETVKLSTDENGNVTGTAEKVSEEPEENIEAHTGRQNQSEGGDGRRQPEDIQKAGNTFLDAFTQNKVETLEVPFEQTSEVFSSQSRDIMNQIMDYMKIQLKPGMDQLEMQLHPESLGSVHIQLTSKGGEVTAQFQVQNEAVKAAIESQITTLQETLKEQGIKVEAVQVTVENHGFESNLWQGQGREENASSQNNKKSPRRINLNALDGIPEENADEGEILAAQMMAANGNTIDYTA